MNLRPLYDRVIIEREQAPEKTKSGLILPSSASTKPNQGTVLAVGEGSLKNDGSIDPLEITIGDTVIFSEYSGDKIKYEGKEYHILSESDILGIVQA